MKDSEIINEALIVLINNEKKENDTLHKKIEDMFSLQCILFDLVKTKFSEAEFVEIFSNKITEKQYQLSTEFLNQFKLAVTMEGLYE